MNNVKLNNMAMNAMLACLYAALTIASSGLSYGGIQFRISEILVLLSFYHKKYIPGLIMGCFLANLASPLGLADIVFGTLASAIACFVMYKVKNIYLAVFLAACVNALIVATVLFYILNLPFLINVFYVFLGEIIVLTLGAYFFKMIEKNEVFMKKYLS